MRPRSNKRPQLVKTVDKTIKIVEEMVKEGTPLGITELYQKTGISKSTIYRLINTLSYHDYIKQDKKTNKYEISLKFFEISSMIINNLDLRGQAKPHLTELMKKTKETIHLAVMDNYEIIFIDRIKSPRTVKMESNMGHRSYAHNNSVGKVIMAYSEKKVIDEIIKRKGLPATTKNTITDEQKFRSHLKNIKKQGYALDNEEGEEGIRCIAGPIFNHSGDIAAAFSISAPAHRFTKENLEKYKILVKDYSQKISRAFGCSQF